MQELTEQEQAQITEFATGAESENYNRYYTAAMLRELNAFDKKSKKYNDLMRFLLRHHFRFYCEIVFSDVINRLTEPSYRVV